MWAKKLFDSCFLDAAFQHLILQFTSRPSLVFVQNSVCHCWSDSRKCGFKYSAPTSPFSSSPFCSSSLYSVLFSRSLFCSFLSSIYFPLLHVYGFDLLVSFSQILTCLLRGLRRNVSEKLFLNIRFIPRLFLDCVTLQNPLPPTSCSP